MQHTIINLTPITMEKMKYEASIACMIPANAVIYNIEADTPEEAKKIARKMIEDDGFEYDVKDIDYSYKEVEIDYNFTHIEEQ